MARNEAPIIIQRESNDDNTDEIVVGSMSPFDVVVVSNTGESVFPARYGGGHYFSYEDTVSSDAVVKTKR